MNRPGAVTFKGNPMTLVGEAVKVGSPCPDFTLHYFGRNPLAGDHAGKVGALGILAEVTRRTNRRLLAIIDVMAGPERGALLVRERLERDGRTAEVERLLVYAVRDGLLSECWVYDQDQTLVDAFLT